MWRIHGGCGMLRHFFYVALLATHILTQSVALAADSDVERDIEQLLEQTDSWVWLGIANKGGSMAFEKGLDLLTQAEQRIEVASVSPGVRAHLQLQAGALRQQLELLSEIYEERFYGVFPLARLIMPSLFIDTGFSNPEHLFHPPDIAAIEVAGENFSEKLEQYGTPRLVIHSEPLDRELEIVVHDTLARQGATLPVSRRELVQALDAKLLAAFDKGSINLQAIGQMMRAFNAERFVVASLSPAAGSGQGLVKYALRGDFYRRGEAVLGSPVAATPVLRVATITSFGSILDRRQQLWPIVLVQGLLLLVSMLWAMRISWGSNRRRSLLYKAMIGLGVFCFGRLFAVVSVMLLSRIAPPAEAMLSATWWWPCLLGLLVILGSGAVAWLGQAFLTNIVPGARGARAVGSIFGLVALGGISNFVAPVLLLEETAGYAILIPFALCSFMLAILFGFALRTGPPVPHYFAIGPLILAPLVGMALLRASPADLWSLCLATGALCVAAAIRHSYAVAKGIEEEEPDPEAAAATDTARLLKLGKKLVRKD